MEADIYGKLGKVEAKADAAHGRLDKIEFNVREDLKEIKSELKEIHRDLNKGKGWAGAAFFLVGIISSAVTLITQYYFGGK